MPVTLTIKNVADSLADKLRARATANHRSLQGELMIILSEAAAHVPSSREPETVYRVKRPRQAPAAHGRRLTLRELWERSRKLGSKSSSESTEIVRTLRDERYGR